MSESVDRVLNGFINLSPNERRQFIEKLNRYERGNDFSKRTLRESVRASVTKMQTGPHGGGCECCGR